MGAIKYTYSFIHSFNPNVSKYRRIPNNDIHDEGNSFILDTATLEPEKQGEAATVQVV